MVGDAQHQGVARLVGPALLLLLMAVAGICTAVDDARAQGSVALDRAALEGLYHATNGPGWTDSTNWLSDAPLAAWFGVATGANGRVTKVDLPGNALVGTIPPALGNVAFLEHLDLGDRWDGRWLLNELSGPIPGSLGNLANLEYLNLGDNALNGPIPGSLGNLANLENLNLGATR